MWRFLMVFILIFGGVSYALLAISRDNVIDDLIIASQKDDVQTMQARVEWDATRANMIADLEKTKRALGSYGSVIGPDLDEMDDIINYYIQADHIDLAYYYHAQIFDDLDEREFIRDIAFAPPWGFAVTLGYPMNFEGGRVADATLRRELKARLIFRLDGLTWKVHNIELPIFIVPRRIYPRDALEKYARNPY